MALLVRGKIESKVCFGSSVLTSQKDMTYAGKKKSSLLVLFTTVYIYKFLTKLSTKSKKIDFVINMLKTFCMTLLVDNKFQYGL